MKSHSALRPSNCKILAGIAAFFFLLSCVARSLRAEQQNIQPIVMDLKLEGEVEPVLATYIDEGLADAARRNSSLVLIAMDTPGGPERFHEGHHPAYSRLVGTGGSLCGTDRRARCPPPAFLSC